MARSAEQGAATAINCAVNPSLNARQAFHYADCQQKEPNSHARYTHVAIGHNGVIKWVYKLKSESGPEILRHISLTESTLHVFVKSFLC